MSHPLHHVAESQKIWNISFKEIVDSEIRRLNLWVKKNWEGSKRHIVEQHWVRDQLVFPNEYKESNVTFNAIRKIRLVKINDN